MKKQLLIPMLLTFCIGEANAQIKVSGVSGTTITGSGSAPSNIVVGNGNPNYNANVYVGQNTGIATPPVGYSPDPTDNTFVGQNSGPLNYGRANTFLGQSTGAANTSGWANVFLGAWTGATNTTGTANTFVGQYCGISNTTGGGNIFIGQGCASSSTTGTENTFVGTAAAGGNTTGTHNVFVGRTAGTNNTTGNNNTAIGYNAGFSLGTLTNATALGQNAQAAASNTVILGGTGANAVNVGVGTASPGALIHAVTTSVLGNSTADLKLTSPGPIIPNNLILAMNATTNVSPLLNAVGSAPAMSMANVATLLTDATSMAIGKTTGENPGSIHFINSVSGASGTSTTECMRINKTNGFVGIHTRSSGSFLPGTAGEPQALFHVNLTNPAYSTLNPLTQGIRFEGLPSASYPNVIVIDANGNLAKAPYGPGGGSNSIDCDSVKKCAWSLSGNNTTGVEFIGTLTNDDFRIQTNGLQRARFTKLGNFDLGSNLTASNNTDTSMTIGNRNILDDAHTAYSQGVDNNTTSSSYTMITGKNNSIITSNSCVASGSNISIENSLSSQATGSKHSINQCYNIFTAGSGNTITSSSAVMALGGSDVINNSTESVLAGEDNELQNGHGCFIGGGHNYADGSYNLLLGNRNRAETTPTAMPSVPLTFTSIMAIGEQIHSDLSRSLSVGFTGNRTTVTTQTGLAVQLDPTALSTYIPTVHFEVDAAVGTSPGPQPLFGPARSNIRFHNLPVAPNPLPAVLIDPNTGELFQSTMSYAKTGSTSGSDLDSLYKENEALKSQIAQMQSKLSGYDEKFASLERSLVQLCEGGCAGLNIHNNDELYQSIPNPTNNDVNISYYLSANYSNASISIITMDGKVVRSYSVNPNKGNGTLNISLGELQPGVYLYNLVVDGKQVGAKKLQKQ